ncbi:methyltransferase domain-containing protein [Leptospira paudalimensis]|uniref:Class I SAM-dependent methyltransferase n=1 Tax=Leptospira paudalimensis TaxID=2950024 RepID=A0ABT3M6C2_9LEPT|nr:methyltransferase domain-containing protein [Leptospira paudalimensis]MCW7503734.1 class I SAM-dependent methyltransferase [Leptospira paudalimensis]
MKESEIRPKELLKTYLDLVAKDAKKLDKNKFERILCPGCGSDKTKLHLTKADYQYEKCETCGTVFCNPRPTNVMLDEFYSIGESSKYWSESFFPAVAEKRREVLFRPKAKKISDFLSNKGFSPNLICDVGSGYGIFLEELKQFYPNASLFGIEPSESMARISEEKGIKTLVAMAEHSNEWSGKFDLVISSEVIEHVHSPMDFLSSVRNLAKPGGYVLLTGLGYEGFDILTLQEKSNSIFPPHHINFMSVKGFEELFGRLGFSDIEVITPGELDVDIVISNAPNLEFTNVLKMRGEFAIKEFQEFLKKYKLSSHVWVFARV